MAVEAGSDEAIVIVDVTIVRGPRSDRCSVARGCVNSGRHRQFAQATTARL